MKLTSLFWCSSLALFVGFGCNPPAEKTAEATGGASKPVAANDIKLGYIVKQPEERWFQIEWMFADKCAKDKGFTLLKLPAQDGDKVMAAIDNLNAQGAKGFVICTPDVRLGPAILKKAEGYGMKVITVDDQFVDADNKIMANVHHMGLSADKIGQLSGQTLVNMAKDKKWPMDKVGVCLVTFDELDTAKTRTDNIEKALLEGGIPKAMIFHAPQKTTDVPGSLDAANILLTQHPEVKYWLVGGMNDTAVIGAVRAMEQRGFTPETCIGNGINGTEAVEEFKKAKATSVFSSVLMRADEHGYKSAEMLYEWVKDGKEPPMDTRTEGLIVSRDNYLAKFKELGIPIE
ncbi:MAG: arabinose ABC transporter substrate-binding protein [Armatimonadetes bacterium]|nr:arabinose ABC transporter substrate-binding protein [Armatimonadota bacterium]